MQSRTYRKSEPQRDPGRMRSWRINSVNDIPSPKHDERGLAEAPKVALNDVETNMDMDQVNGLFQDKSPPDKRPNGFSKMQSSPVVPSALMSPPSPSPEPEPEPTPWSSAIGHASTGKSGRVIERLQADIDRLNRDLKLLKARLNDSEKARENLVTHNVYLQDRNSNYEQSQEANSRQMQRKDRMIEDMRENLSREKLRVATAEQGANEAAANEETWRHTASQSRSRAEQRENEYASIVACRNMESKSFRSSLRDLKNSLRSLTEAWTRDKERCDRLQLIAEQQSRTITQLQELNGKTNANFQAYRTEVDQTITDLKALVGSNEVRVREKVEEMGQVTGKMKWVMAVDRGRRK